MAMISKAQLFEALQGEVGIRRWVERFYEAVRSDALLAPLFPAELTETKQKQWAFFVEFFSGQPVYTTQYGKPFLRYKHRHVKIGRAERDRWMQLVMESLATLHSDQAVLDTVQALLEIIADAMINHDPQRKDSYYFN